MTIRNNDGTIYRPTGTLTAFDHSSPDQELLNMYDQEAFRLGGMKVQYFPVFIPQSVIDPLYQESRSKVWSQYPIDLYCFYEPIPSTNNLGIFGIDAPDELVIEFNYQYVIDTLGGPPKIGSRIFTPHLREHWELIQCNTGGYQLWSVFRLQMICKRFQSSTTDNSKPYSIT